MTAPAPAAPKGRLGNGQLRRLWGAKTRHRLLTCEYGCGGDPRAGSIAGL
jgi:hypothetical protein